MDKGQYMSEMAAIGQSMRRMFDAAEQPTLAYGNVSKVDEQNKTIDVRIGDGGLVIPDISLSTVSGGDSSVLFYPSVGSLVVLGMPYRRPEAAFVVQFTAVDRIDINISDYSCRIDKDSIYLFSSGGASAEIKGDTVTLNGGQTGGMVIPSAITSALNRLVSAFNNHTHTVPNGTSSTPITRAGTFNADDYTNKKVMQ